MLLIRRNHLSLQVLDNMASRHDFELGYGAQLLTN